MNADPDRQMPFLTYGFRPFFLFAGSYAVIVMLAWLAWLSLHSLPGVLITPTIAGPPHQWHGHQMIFGYAVAVLSGFMLTAMPNWTGARRIAGLPLLVLAVTWLLGRLAMWFSALLPPLLVAIVDFAYLPMLAVVVAASLFVRPAARHLVFLLFIVLLLFANAAIHAEWLGLADDLIRQALACALLILALMIGIIGGRIVPSFSRNALLKQGETQHLPQSHRWLDRLSIGSIASLIPVAALDATGAVPALLAAIACLANVARLSLWQGHATLHAPILWSLHLAYTLLTAGFGLLALAHVTSLVSVSAALHFIAIGGIGLMTLAVMTRAALGHTGRPLVASHSVTLCYLLIALAAVVRSLGVALLPQHYTGVLVASATLWIAAFGLFTAVYAPMLTGPSTKVS